ncbi:MAG: hypothetical protein LBC75_05790 [Fibromonadaceae bacterium]|jgi:hypothetical protein|nr:hypothetical protein [Fibromonadaceae bacterium]
MKKVLAAALICVASSFAAWDYFPVIEYGKGEAKFSFEQGRQANASAPGEDHDFKIRYSPLENLELLSQLGYTFGARFQIIPVISAGVDIGFPIPGTAWSFTPNVQFSTNLTEALAVGTNVQVTINTEDANKDSDGMDLSAGIEFDLTMGKSTVWVSCDFNTGLTVSKHDGKAADGAKVKDEGRGVEIVPTLGYVAAVGNLSLGTSVGWKIAEDEKVATVIGLDASIKF